MDDVSTPGTWGGSGPAALGPGCRCRGRGAERRAVGPPCPSEPRWPETPTPTSPAPPPLHRQALRRHRRDKLHCSHNDQHTVKRIPRPTALLSYLVGPPRWPWRCSSGPERRSPSAGTGRSLRPGWPGTERPECLSCTARPDNRKLSQDQWTSPVTTTVMVKIKLRRTNLEQCFLLKVGREGIFSHSILREKTIQPEHFRFFGIWKIIGENKCLLNYENIKK